MKLSNKLDCFFAEHYKFVNLHKDVNISGIQSWLVNLQCTQRQFSRQFFLLLWSREPQTYYGESKGTFLDMSSDGKSESFPRIDSLDSSFQKNSLVILFKKNMTYVLLCARIYNTVWIYFRNLKAKKKKTVQCLGHFLMTWSQTTLYYYFICVKRNIALWYIF